jgi:hypothetical protein
VSEVHRLLVTGGDSERVALWVNIGAQSNWIEGRENAHGTETWLVTVFADSRSRFLNMVGFYEGLTVEEIEGAGDSETYRLLVGKPGTGWAAP